MNYKNRKNNLCYKIIDSLYFGKFAKRSKVPYINHIDEGLIILDEIGASKIAKEAYCLHPVFQDDMELLSTFNLLSIESYSLDLISKRVLILSMEYRNIANAYLSNREIDDVSLIELSPLKDVNDMLIADKVQNKKDFDIYHKGNHKRSGELNIYFNNWLTRLNITGLRYLELIDKVDKGISNE